jgi:hypothetical protein
VLVFWRTYGAILRFRQSYLSILENFLAIASRKNEHYSPTGGKIMVPGAAILSSHRQILQNFFGAEIPALSLNNYLGQEYVSYYNP